jgi:hypothetical protein
MHNWNILPASSRVFHWPGLFSPLAIHAFTAEENTLDDMCHTIGYRSGMSFQKEFILAFGSLPATAKLVNLDMNGSIECK